MLPSVFGRDLFDDWFDFPFFDDSEMRKAEKRLYGHHEKGIMKTDVQENDTSYNLVMDLPGFKKEDVKVALKDGYLTISAEKNHDHDEEEKKNGRFAEISGNTVRMYEVKDGHFCGYSETKVFESNEEAMDWVVKETDAKIIIKGEDA